MADLRCPDRDRKAVRESPREFDNGKEDRMTYLDSFADAARDYWTPDPGAEDPASGEDPDACARPDASGVWYGSWTGPDLESLARPDRCYACGRTDGRTLAGSLLCADCGDGTPDGVTLEF